MDAARRERRRHHRKAAAATGAAAAGMTPGGGVGGAAEATAYGDVFGGPPRFTAPSFVAAPVDYTEVFGGVSAACSIPFLDLPPAAAVAVGGDDDDFFACKGKGDDYGEIFNRFDFADFALPYEDLFGTPDPEREPEVEEIASSSGSSRSSIYKESSQFEDEAPILPQQYQNLDNVQHFKEHRTTERRPDDLVEVTTCTVKPSKEHVIDPHKFSHGQETDHVSRFNDGTMANSDNGKNTSSASVCVTSPDNEFLVGQKKQTSSWPPISGSVSANESHTDSHSAHSSVCVTPPDYTFLRVSDVDAQTQPIKVQPSSGQQPKPLNKENAAKGDANLVNQFTPTSVHTPLRSNTPQADKKADADVDANLASASAAMKEAMDFAEARLKAARELLEGKGNSFKLWKKPSHSRSTRSTEIKATVSVDVDISKQKLSMKKSLKEEKNVEDSLSDKHKKSSASRSDYSDERAREKPQQMMAHCTESCQTYSKIEKLGNWRSGHEFYEPTGDYRKNRTDKTTVENYNCRRTSFITSLSKDKKSETEFSATDPELEIYEKLWEVNDGMDEGGKHANLREQDTASLVRDSASVILETSTENMAHQETCKSKLEGLITTPENAKESHDDFDDEYVELPSMMATSRKLDSNKDKSGPLSEAYSSGNDASVLRDLGNSSPNVSPVSGTSQKHTNSKVVPEVQCDGGVQCTSGSNQQLQEIAEVSNPDISLLANVKSLIQKELGGSYVPDAALREKFSFVGESFLHNEDAETKEVPSEEAARVKIEEKVDACAHSEETVVDVSAEFVEENNIDVQNKILADSEESHILDVFEVASKLIKRDLDQEIGESGSGEVDSRMEGTNGFISDLKSKEEETSLENRDKTGTEEGSTHGNMYMNSSESTIRGQSDFDAEFNITVEEVGSESFSGATGDSTTRATVTSQDEAAFSSEMFSHMQHPVQKDEAAMSQKFNVSAPDGEETVEVCSLGERELPREKSTCEENKNRANKMAENSTTSRIPEAEHGPSPLAKACCLPKSAESPTLFSAETMKMEALGVRRTNERDNITRTESEKDKVFSQRREEAKESGRRSQKERELAEERERRKIEEEERERERERERRKIEEEERERERKKDRLAVERATREAHERAFAEAREKAEKMAFERMTAARQRASAEAREKERASAAARIKAERAAVERATAEARERAIEKAKAEKALAEARERYRSSIKERSINQDLRQGTQFQRATSSNFTRNPDSSSRVAEVESALRHKAKLERHQRTAERVTKALAEKNMRDLLAQREQAEKHRLSEFLNPEIKRWSNGKEGNLRALLSTLQYILGAESGWQPVPLTDLITAAAVKKAYRKATLCVHPDKLQQRGATIRQKYICEKVFDLLKDAWNKFNSEER